mmetsp:Transcript_38288/g.83294  ORF Transcript_38288/g.83294 Transcript_38288/m.83294 type:complete len:200 (+) Transcript_38288:626-1225(+)
MTRGTSPFSRAPGPSLAAMRVRHLYTFGCCPASRAAALVGQRTAHSVCCRVFTTSSGLVTAAASPPATPPASKCVVKLSSNWSRSASGARPCARPRTCFAVSYTEKCTAVYGTFIRIVVRYDRKKVLSPSSRDTRDTQSQTPLYGLPGSCRRCFTTSMGRATASLTTVASAPETAATPGSTWVLPGLINICLDFSYAAK